MALQEPDPRSRGDGLLAPLGDVAAPCGTVRIESVDRSLKLDRHELFGVLEVGLPGSVVVVIREALQPRLVACRYQLRGVSRSGIHPFEVGGELVDSVLTQEAVGRYAITGPASR